MGILKSSSVIDKTDAQRVVGVVLPERISTYFSLFVSAKGCTKATIFRELMQKWWDHKTVKEPESKLLETLFNKIQKEWDSIKLKVPEKNIEDFRSELQQELRKKGLKEIHIKTILNKLKE
jgi:hypothetical protein